MSSNLKSTYLVVATMLILLTNIHLAKAGKNNETVSIEEELAEYLWLGSDLEVARMLASSSNNALDASKVIRKCSNNNPSYCLPDQNRNKNNIYCGTRNRGC